MQNPRPVRRGFCIPGSAGGQFVLGAYLFVTSLRPLDSLLLSYSAVFHCGESPRTIRARCRIYRYPFTRLGNVTAVNERLAAQVSTVPKAFPWGKVPSKARRMRVSQEVSVRKKSERMRNFQISARSPHQSPPAAATASPRGKPFHTEIPSLKLFKINSKSSH